MVLAPVTNDRGDFTVAPPKLPHDRVVFIDAICGEYRYVGNSWAGVFIPAAKQPPLPQIWLRPPGPTAGQVVTGDVFCDGDVSVVGHDRADHALRPVAVEEIATWTWRFHDTVGDDDRTYESECTGRRSHK